MLRHRLRHPRVLHRDGDHQLMMLRIDRICFGDLAGPEAAHFAHQLPRVPLGLALDPGVLVLDLLAVRREPRDAAIAARDHDHAVGLHDRQVVGWIHEVAHGVAHTLRVLGTFAASHAASAHAAAAPAAAAPAHAAAATTTATTPAAVVLVSRSLGLVAQL